MDPGAKYFDIENFETQWNGASESQQIFITKKAARLSPEQGIVPALAGFLSSRSRVSTAGAATLTTLVRKTGQTVSNRVEDGAFLSGMQATARVAARIYGTLISLDDETKTVFLFSLLANMGGMGPATAFMALVRGHCPLTILAKNLKAVSQAGRLALTAHYITATPQCRLDLAPLFIKILSGITSRSAVLDFFAALFDRRCDTDPILYHIRPKLRAPEPILENELVSGDPHTRVRALKALSMVTDKIPISKLESLLTTAEPQPVRNAVYSIIQQAAPGTYADLFTPLLDLIPKIPETEAQQTLAALAASGRHPMFRIVEILESLHPDRLSGLVQAAGRLTRTGFLFIQDMALHPDRYREGSHLAINRACILGMTRKRPERVAALLGKASSNKAASDFIHQINHLLDREKKDIAAPFLASRSRSLTTGPAMPKSAIPARSVKDEPERISCRNFSQLPREHPLPDFRKMRIQRCRFSGTVLTDLSFDTAVVVDSDFSGTVFEGICFDNSLWINVDARGAVFRNCRFEGARICNTDFSGATIVDAFFIGATLAGITLKDTDISFTSFAFSQVAGLRLDDARTDHLDFSGVRARFSRFPPLDRRTAEVVDIDYNARKFQPAMDGLPPLNSEMIQKINLLIFCEFTHYGEAKFLRQNKLSLVTALDIFRPEQSDLFRIIPVLLHANLSVPYLEGIHGDTPCGIADYIPQASELSRLSDWAGIPAPAPEPHPTPAILGVYTIGSVGSVAQTSDSDIDYWVCIRETEMGSCERALLETKLSMIETMAREHFKTEITFFIVDIQRVKANDFGDSSMESSGSAQAGLLKEEFYRTMIHLAGKLPLWAVLPAAISRRYYPAIARMISPPTRFCRYLDLGDIHEISSGEYFGASIWQMFKWVKSPFKSILKMALLEKYFFQSGNTMLLCNQYKTEWMHTGSRLQLARNDAYFFLMKHLIRFYEDQKDPHSVNLLVTCFFLKLKISDSQETPTGIRNLLLDRCLKTWGWDIKKAKEVGRISNWPYQNIVRLSRALEAYILKKYKRVTSACSERGILDTMISAEDRTVLEHKVKIEYSRQPMKVRKVLLVSRGDRHFSRLFLKCTDTLPPTGRWALIHQLQDGSDDLVCQAQTVEEIGAWLVVNSLFSRQTRIRLLSSPFPISEEDIRRFYIRILEFFSTRLKEPVPFKKLLAYPEKKAVLASVNFYGSGTSGPITHYTALYINGWNELFCQSGHAPQGFISMAHVKRDLSFRLRMPRLPGQSEFFVRETP